MSLIPENQIKLAVDEGNISTKKPLIIFADDEEHNCDILQMIFEKSGFDTKGFMTGDSLYEYLVGPAASKPDVIVLDIMMPGTDGIGILKKIKSHATFKHIPVVLQTSDTNESRLIQGIEAGAYYYVTKPFSHAVIKSVVSSAIQEKKQSDELKVDLVNLNNVIDNIISTKFELRNFVEVRKLANYIARFTDEPSKYVVSLTALMINAIEHGNLGLGFDEKSQLISQNKYEEEIQRRLSLPENAAKKVEVELVKNHGEDSYSVTIKDQGLGFDWAEYVDFDPNRMTDPNGRGIAMAFIMNPEGIEYVGSGNKVVYQIKKAQI